MILATGAAGYLGSHFVLACDDAGEEVVAMDEGALGRRRVVPRAVPFHRGYCGDRSFLARILEKYEVATVVHFGALNPSQTTHPLSIYEQAVSETRSLLAACVLAGVRSFVFASDVAASQVETPVRGGGCRGRALLAAERMVADVCAAHDIKFAVLRSAFSLGADPKGRSGPIGGATGVDARLSAAIAATARTGEIQITHPLDFAGAALSARKQMASDGARPETLTIVSATVGDAALQSAVARAKTREGHTGAPPAVPTAPVAPLDRWAPAHTDIDSILSSEIAWRDAESRREAPGRAA